MDSDERASEHGERRVGLLDRRVGGSQHRRVDSGLVRPGEVVLVDLVGLVPDFERGEIRRVAAGQVGDELGQVGVVLRGPGVGRPSSRRRAAGENARRGRGRPTGRALHHQHDLDPGRGRVPKQAVGVAEHLRIDLPGPGGFHRRPGDFDAHQLGVQSGGLDELSLELGGVCGRRHAPEVQPAEQRRAGAAGRRRMAGCRHRQDERDGAEQQRADHRRLVQALEHQDKIVARSARGRVCKSVVSRGAPV